MLGAVTAEFNHEFNKEVLIVGVVKGLALIVSTFIFGLISRMVDITVNFGGQMITPVGAVEIMITAVATFYVGQALLKFAKLINYKSVEEEDINGN